MNFLKHRILKNLTVVNYLLILFFFFYSVFVIRYHYDGHHIGLIYSNATDLINGKLPYKEIFIQYGFLTTLIHSIILFLFENKIFFISFFTCVFYSLTIFFISKSIKNFVNIDYALIGSLIILMNHPVPWLPWSNYLAFFFISISIFLLSKKNKNILLLGFFLSLSVLSRQDFLIPIIFSAVLLFIFNIKDKKKFNFNYIAKIIFGFVLPILLFIFYLLFIGVYHEWLGYLIIPKFYLEIYNTSLLNLIYEYIIFFTTDSFFNFIITPQYFVISIILISNSILIFLKLVNKIKIQDNIFFIILLSCLLSLVCLKIEIFRLYTSVILGLIAILYFLNKIKDYELKKNLRLLILLPSLFSIIFYPLGNNPSFIKINFNIKNSLIFDKRYSFHKWPGNKINSINIITDLTLKCDVEFLENLTFDSTLSTIGKFNRIKIQPYALNSNRHNKFFEYINRIKNPNFDFIDLINNEIKKQNIIVIFNLNNNFYKDKKINFSSDYSHLEINESNFIGRPNILRVYFPSKCIE
jgi:hypothetical protein